MNIGSICSRQIVTINAGGSIQQAALLMRDSHVGSLVVTDGTDEDTQVVVGIVTDRDLTIDALARGVEALRAPIIDFAGDELLGAPESTELTEAVELMRTAGVRRLLVHNDEGTLVGLVSFDDLVPACVAPLVGLAEVLRQEVQRETLEREPITTLNRTVLRVPVMAAWSNNQQGVAAATQVGNS